MRRILGIGLMLLLAVGGLFGQDSSAVRPSRRDVLAMHIGGFYPSAFHNRFAVGVTVHPFARVPLAVTAGVMTQRARSLSLNSLAPDFPVLATVYRSRAWMLGLRYFPFQHTGLKVFSGVYLAFDAGQQYELLGSYHIYAVSDAGTILYEQTQLGWWLSLGSRHDWGRRFLVGAAIYLSGNQLQEKAPASRLLSAEIAVGVRL